MSKSTLATLALGTLVLGALIVPELGLAKAPPISFTAKMACISKAAVKRDQALGATFIVYGQNLNTAYSARATALSEAYTASTTSAVKAGVAAATVAFNAAKSNAKTALSASQVPINATYKTTVTACNAGDFGPSDSTLNDDLVSYWKFDESTGNAVDAVGANTLTNNNSATYTSGKINKGIVLSAASSQSMSKSSPSGIPGAGATGGDMSISLWVKMTSQPGMNLQVPLIALWDGTSDLRSWVVFYFNDSSDNKWIRFNSSSDGARPADCKLRQTLANGVWHHVVVVYTAGIQCEIFVDGSSIGTGSVSDSLFSTPAALTFGADDNFTNAYLDGEEDEVGLWARALISSEIADLYRNGAGKSY